MDTLQSWQLPVLKVECMGNSVMNCASVQSKAGISCHATLLGLAAYPHCARRTGLSMNWRWHRPSVPFYHVAFRHA